MLLRVKALFVFMNHGTSVPKSTYPDDVYYSNSRIWSSEPGQLTDEGLQQANNTGQLLKKRYGSFTSPLKRNEIFLRSSASQRCIDTLSMVNDQLWPNRSRRHTIYTMPKPIDSLLYRDPECPEVNDEEEKNLNSSTAQIYQNKTEIQELYFYTSQHTGLPNTMNGAIQAFHSVRSYKVNGKGNPFFWATKDDYFQQMGHVYTRKLNMMYSSEKALRLRAGPILQEVVEVVRGIESNNNSKNGSTHKVNLYSTVRAHCVGLFVKQVVSFKHDNKLASLLLALGEPLDQYPSYASAIIFEVYQMQNDFEIRAFLVSDNEGKAPYQIEMLRLRKCLGLSDYRCKFSNFVDYLQPLLNVSWTKECGLSNGSFDAIQVAEENVGMSD